MILHIPHASKEIPYGFIDDYNVTNLNITNNFLVDHFTDELFVHKCETIIAKYNRAWCDVEKYTDDSLEQGFGYIYTKDVFGDDLRTISSKTKNIIDNYYNKHHQQLISSCEQHQTLFDTTIIVDCHSFYPYIIDKFDRPLVNKFNIDICLGYNKNTPLDLIASLTKICEHNGLNVGYNTPYSGAILPSRYTNSTEVFSVMIEVNKKLYMRPPYFYTKNQNFNKTKEIIDQLLDTIYKYNL